MKKLFALVLAVFMVFMTFTFTACGEKDPENQSVATEKSDKDSDEVKSENKPHTDMTLIKRKGKITVGITNYMPFNYKDENGKWIGFDTELAEAFAERLGVEVEFFEINWDEKFDKLNDGTIDCVWNCMTITDEAKQKASVSDAYFKSSQVVVLHADKADSVNSINDLKDFTFDVANSAGQYAAESNGLKYTLNHSMYIAMAGKSDYYITDRAFAEAVISKGEPYDNLSIAMTLCTDECGVAFRKGSDLTAEFNTFIKEYKDSGNFDELVKKYNIYIEE